MSYHNHNHFQLRQENGYDDGGETRYYEEGHYQHELSYNHYHNQHDHGGDDYYVFDEDNERDEILEAIRAEMERDEIDDELNRAMHNSCIGTTSTTTDSGTTSALSLPTNFFANNANNDDHIRDNPLAAEYWYPECRDCPCCRGFKHGCEGCVGGYCFCSGGSRRVAEGDDGVGGLSATVNNTTTVAASLAAGTTINNDSSDIVAKMKGRGGNVDFGKAFAGRGRGNGRSHEGSDRAKASGSRSLIPCRFYQMGTCKFGNGCRFSHS